MKSLRYLLRSLHFGVAGVVAVVTVACSGGTEDVPVDDEIHEVGTEDRSEVREDVSSFEIVEEAPIDATPDATTTDTEEDVPPDEADTHSEDASEVDVSDVGAEDADVTAMSCSDGQPLADHQRCDNQPDCSNAEDEWECDWYQCDNGTRLPIDPASLAVSGSCPGSPDYVGFPCDPYLSSSATLPWESFSRWRCNGVPDCTIAISADGLGGFTSRDEADCPGPAFSCLIVEGDFFYSEADMVALDRVCDGVCDCTPPSRPLGSGWCRDEFIPGCDSHRACGDNPVLLSAICDGSATCPETRCDGTVDCDDGSDESGCDDEDLILCPVPFGSGIYVSPQQLCDDIPNCVSGWDEGSDNCFPCVTPSGASVVALTARCDGTIDCTDASDESFCP